MTGPVGNSELCFPGPDLNVLLGLASRNIEGLGETKLAVANSPTFGKNISVLTGGTSYICDLLQVYHSNRNLRSASRGLSLVVPAYQTQAYGARSFSVAAPTLWNSLPVDIKNAQSLFIFKKKLKTFLFNQLHT